MALSTDDQIEFAVHDDAAALKRLFTLPVSARLDALAAMRGVSSFDGAGMEMLRQIHERGDGFRVAVDDPRYPVAIDRLVKADAAQPRCRMTPSPYVQSSPQLTADRGRWCLSIDWASVPVVYDYLRLRGCRSTLCLDPISRAAHVVLWPGVDPYKAADLLGRLTGRVPVPLRQAA